jgi:hypothetical protein
MSCPFCKVDAEQILENAIKLDQNWKDLYDALADQRNELLELCKAALDAMMFDLMVFQPRESSHKYVDVMNRLRVEIEKAGG